LRGVVEEQCARVAEERGGHAQSAVHPEGEGRQASAGHLPQTHDLQDLVGAFGRGPGRGGEHAQVAAGGPGGVAGDVAEEDAHRAGRVGVAVQGAAAEQRDAAARFEFEHQPQGRGLAGAAVAEQNGDLAGAGVEGEVVDGRGFFAPGRAGQSDGLDHHCTITRK
jgi:hypothetical protein